MHIFTTIIKDLKETLPQYGDFHNYTIDDDHIHIIMKNVTPENEPIITAHLTELLEKFYSTLILRTLISGTYTYVRNA